MSLLNLELDIIFKDRYFNNANQNRQCICNIKAEICINAILF